VATCPVCKQGICAKCLEYGQDGMCGMCVEIASARKATQQANRPAATAAAAARPAAPAAPAAKPAAPAGTPPAPPAKPGTGPRPAGRPPAPQPAAKGGTSGNLPPAPKPTAKPGMCAEHPDQPAKASCTHCSKRVCPFCLDLYDLCADCRQLPQCARHESMVGATKCGDCKMNFCKVCLDGTEYCDRCRTLRQAAGKPVRYGIKPGAAPPKAGSGGVKSPTQSLARTPTGNLNGKADAPKPPAGGAPAKAAPAAAGKAPSGKFQPGAAKAALEKSSGPPWPVIGVVAVVVLIAAWRVFGGRPTLPPEEAVAALRNEMGLVQKAAMSAATKNGGAFPTTSAAILDELKTEGVAVDDLPLPLKLSVGTPATEPLAITYMRVGESFEVRALDADGRPLADNGRDVVLRPTSADDPDASPRRKRPRAGADASASP
jgi:hypothetical protein